MGKIFYIYSMADTLVRESKFRHVFGENHKIKYDEIK